MAVRLVEEREKKTLDIDVEGETVKVYYQNPTAKEWIADEKTVTGAYFYNKEAMGEALSTQRLNRIQTVVCGWEGVVDKDDKPIPYAFERLLALMTQSQEVHTAVCNLADDVYNGIEQKNSSSSSGISSTDDETNPPNSAS